MRARALLLALCALLVSPNAGAQTTSTTSTTSTTAPEARRQREIEERIRELKAAIGEASAEEAELLGELSETQAQLDGFDAAIARIDRELAAASDRVAVAEADVQRLDARYLALTAKLHETRANIDEMKDDVGDITSELYRQRGGGRVAVMTNLALDAATPQDLIAGAQYLSIVAEIDQDRVDRLVLLKERVEYMRAGLEDERDEARAARDVVAAERANIASLKAEQQRARGQVAAAVNNQERLLAKVHAQKDRFNAELNALQAESNSIAGMLRGRQSGQVFVGSGSGLLGVPISAALTSGFGSRRHPILGVTRMHNGVDFGARSGTPVVAAGDGEVVWAGARGGYGNTVIIDHGNTLATLYAHMSSVSVGVGQNVTRGQLVGAVGSTGLSTGPHLHFEVRQSGTPVNPLIYL
ncbi:MAG TPA: peptidoglycan DD-metalloendopeptidase family protein [Acidimicrobiia bacterium]|nr:peptidoglycan DD-metalloendopeptidase family protein [Acidimicrobiia bacterium]